MGLGDPPWRATPVNVVYHHGLPSSFISQWPDVRARGR